MHPEGGGQICDHASDQASCRGAGDENRTRTISLGIGPIGVGTLCDLRGRLAAGDRDGPPAPGANCTLIARRSWGWIAVPLLPMPARFRRTRCRSRACRCVCFHRRCIPRRGLGRHRCTPGTDPCSSWPLLCGWLPTWWASPDRRRSLPGAGAVKGLVRRTSKMLWPCRGSKHARFM